MSARDASGILFFFFFSIHLSCRSPAPVRRLFLVPPSRTMNRGRCLEFAFALLAVCFASDSARAWDLGVLTTSQMVFLRRQKQSNATQDTYAVEFTAADQLKNMVAVAYDSINKVTYLTDSYSQHGSIFRINSAKPKPFVDVEPVVAHQKETIQGLAINEHTSTLYWTTGNYRTINYLNLPENNTKVLEPENVKVFITFINELPQGIAIDTCRGYLYWTNINHLNASIGRIRLNGTGRQDVVNTGLYQPIGIAVDAVRGMLYWSNGHEGGMYYSIESSGLDGGNRRTVIHGTHHQPFAVALDDRHVYWSDWVSHAVWSLPRNGSDERPAEVVWENPIFDPMGLIASLDNSAAANETFCAMNRIQEIAAAVTDSPLKPLHDLCLNYGVLHASNMTCVCAPGYSGPDCGTSVCDGYCLADGECSVDESGRPRCRCPASSGRLYGDRCETQTCAKRCQNGGQCAVDPATREQRCECPADYEGETCQYRSFLRDDLCTIYCQHSVPESAAHWTYCGCDNKRTDFLYKESSCKISRSIMAVFVILVLFIASLCTITLVLAKKVRMLGRRPRIKKRIVVNKSITPLTSCRPPQQQNQQCEITIENCCNMNICETPCFEPDYRPPKQGGLLSKGKSKKEDKATLLSNTDMTSSEDEKPVY